MDSVEKTRRKLKGDPNNLSESFEEISVDWRGRPCKLNKHGGMASAIFVLGLSLSSLYLSLSLYIVCMLIFCLSRYLQDFKHLR